MSSSLKPVFSVLLRQSKPRLVLPLTGALLALSLAAGACTDEFGSCFETRTCPKEAGEGGAGGDGTSGSNAGGSSPLEGGSTGKGGSTGEGGTAGGDSQRDALTIESVSPADQSLGVERNAVVEVVFSEEVDGSTVDEGSFRVTGPAGLVPGSLRVDGATVEFTANRPWALLSTYAVELSTDLFALSGAALAEKSSFTFQVRDGAFTKPLRLSSRFSHSLAMKGGESGHVAVHWVAEAASKNMMITLYRPASRSWTEPGVAEANAAQNYSSGCVTSNDAGEVFAILGSNPPLWNRAVDGEWGTAATSKPANATSCALGNDRTAITTWQESPGSGWNYYAAILAEDGVWSEPQLLQPNAVAHGVIRYGRGFLAFHAREDEGGRLYSRIYDPDAGWSAAQPVTPAGLAYNYWSVDAKDEVAMHTWIGADGLARASAFDGEAWSSHELGLAAAGTHASVGVEGHLAAWSYDGNAYAARYDLESGWEDPVKLGSAYVEPIWGPAATIDAAGNSLAVWPSGGSSILWRRLPAGSDEWSEVQEIPDQDPQVVFSEVDDSGNVMIVWSNALGVWASRFE